MFSSLIAYARMALGVTLIAVNTIIHAVPLLVVALIKLLIPIQRARIVLSRMLVVIAESWIGVNSWGMRSIGRVRVHVHASDALRARGWYLVMANHQSWLDIPVLQMVFNRRIPFLKFFLKRELIWVPLLGLAWWALDFPFMRRFSREQLARKPELHGKDMQATRRACEKFRHLPVSIMNFVEGTRFTQAKHDRQRSPYVHLLKPRAGGAAFVLDAMGDMLDALVDVTLVYSSGRMDFKDLLLGRVGDVHVHVRVLPIPAELLGHDYATDREYRVRFQAWLNDIWREKDACIDRLTAL